MIFVKRFASFQDTEGQLQKFTHSRTDNGHLAQTALLQAHGEAFDDRVIFDGIDGREIKSFAHARIAGL